MAHGIYICSAEGNTGKSTIALGTLETLARRVRRVGVYRPIIRPGLSRDYVLDLLLAHDAVRGIQYEDAVGVTYDEVHGHPDAALQKIISKYKAIEDRCDAMLVVGSDYTDVASPTELAFNARVAANLGTPVLLTLGGRQSEWRGHSDRPGHTGARAPLELTKLTELATEELARERATLLGVVVNRADPGRLEEIIHAVSSVATWGGAFAAQQPRSAATVPVWAVPEDPFLVAPTMRSVLEAVDGELYVGDPDLLDRETLAIVIAAMSLENVLDRLVEGALVIVPGDRAEIVLGILTAHASVNFPSLSGVVLNGGFSLGEPVERLVVGLKAGLPMIRTSLSTYAAALAVSQTRGRVAAESQRKRDTALTLFENYLAPDTITNLLELSTADVVTPLMFEYQLLERARAVSSRIVLTEGSDDRSLRATATLLARGVAELTLIGEEIEIRGRALGLGLDISRAEIVSNEDYVHLYRHADNFRQLLAEEISAEQARDTVRDPVFFSAMAVATGEADGMVSGLSHTTERTFNPATELEAGTVLSRVHVLALADLAVLFVDAAISGKPTAAHLAQIALTSVITAIKLGIEPRVAILGSRVNNEVTAAGVALVQEKMDAAGANGFNSGGVHMVPTVEGPMSYDEAVAKRATIRIFVEPFAAGSAADAMRHSSGALVVGPFIQGGELEVGDLPRDATARDVVNTVAVTAILANR